MKVVQRPAVGVERDNFHGRKDVAALKAVLQRHHNLRVRDFHGRKDVAALKVRDDAGRATWPTDFHGRKAGASLKEHHEPVAVNSIERISTAERTWPH